MTGDDEAVPQLPEAVRARVLALAERYNLESPAARLVQALTR